MLNIFYIQCNKNFFFFKNYIKYISLINSKYYYTFFLFFFFKKKYYENIFKKKFFFFKLRYTTLLINLFRPSNYFHTSSLFLVNFFLYLKNSWNTFRIFFGYPRFSKTRNNCNSSKVTSRIFQNFLYKYVYKKYLFVFSNKNKYVAMYVEFFNKLWFYYWNLIWDHAHNKFVEFKKKRSKKMKIGTFYALSNRAFTFLPKKLKINKKKIKIPENIFNIGFYFLFSKRIKKTLINFKNSKKF